MSLHFPSQAFPLKKIAPKCESHGESHLGPLSYHEEYRDIQLGQFQPGKMAVILRVHDSFQVSLPGEAFTISAVDQQNAANLLSLIPKRMEISMHYSLMQQIIAADLCLVYRVYQDNLQQTDLLAQLRLQYLEDNTYRMCICRLTLRDVPVC